MAQNNDDLEVEDLNGQPSQSGQGGRKPGKSRRNLYLVVSLVCLLVAFVAIIYIVKYFTVRNRGEEVYESLQAEVVTPSTEPEPVSSEPPASEPESTQETQEDLEEAMTRVIDFDSLTADTNKDIYAWIYVPDTNIDYPILQHPSDDTYYLNYNMDGSKGYPGCIYTEIKNDKEFTDFNTILYGHNMKNGTMFHDLHNFKDEVYMDEHPYVYIYLPDKTLKYQIFAAYPYDDRHLLYSFDYNSEKVREGYLNDIFNMKNLSAVIDHDVETSADSNIITMSTCIGGQSSNRYLVQAVLIN